MKRKTLLFLLAAPALYAGAIKLPENLDFSLGPEEQQKPVLSATGKKRLQENIRTLELNIKDLKDNLAATDKNLETLRAELRELDGLEKDHLELRKRYDLYLAKAAEEMKRNEKAKRDLAKWEESGKAAPEGAAQGAVKDKLEAARLEMAERDRWKFDAESKTAKVKQLMAGLESNLRDIRSRRKPLQQQLTSWTARRETYTREIANAEQKKAKWEKVIVR